MNPYWLILSVAAQIACLAHGSFSVQALIWASAYFAGFAFFALTGRLWSTHLDMYLFMAGPGGFAMLLPEFITGQSCAVHMSPTHLAWMIVAMLVCTLPLTWQFARCMQPARLEGRAMRLLSLDAIGMQIGMLAVYSLTAFLNPLTAARLQQNPITPWLLHLLMLVGMSLGMFALTSVRTAPSRATEPLA